MRIIRFLLCLLNYDVDYSYAKNSVAEGMDRAF